MTMSDVLLPTNITCHPVIPILNLTNDHVRCVVTNQHYMSSCYSYPQSSVINTLDLRTATFVFQELTSPL